MVIYERNSVNILNFAIFLDLIIGFFLFISSHSVWKFIHGIFANCLTLQKLVCVQTLIAILVHSRESEVTHFTLHHETTFERFSVHFPWHLHCVQNWHAVRVEGAYTFGPSDKYCERQTPQLLHMRLCLTNWHEIISFCQTLGSLVNLNSTCDYNRQSGKSNTYMYFQWGIYQNVNYTWRLDDLSTLTNMRNFATPKHLS